MKVPKKGWGFAHKGKPRLASSDFKRPEIIPLNIPRSQIVVIDFETYYDDDYTLKKLSTSEYVRDSRFKVHMMGIKVGRRKTRVVPGDKVKLELMGIDWSKTYLLCHNTQFDGFILHEHYGIKPAFYLDTLSMARGLHSNDIGAGLDDVAKYYGRKGKLEGVLESTRGIKVWSKELFANVAEYCANDVDETLAIFEQMHPKMPADEMRLINLTCRMFCVPVLKVDLPRVQRELDRELKARKDLLLSVVKSDAVDLSLLKKSERSLPEEERRLLSAKRIVGSNERFAALLRAEGVEPPVKISKAWISKSKDDRKDEDKFSYAFAKDDQAFLDLPASTEGFDLEDPKQVAALAARQERLQNLVDCRLAVKSTSNVTRAERFLEAGKNGASLPVGYAYYRAHTGRWGGQNKMNMQNLRRGGELRLSILAPKGYVLCVVDSGQIEARVNAWLWGQTDLLDAFRAADRWDKSKGVARGNDRDAYCLMADDIYGFEVTTENKTERFVGKVCVLGLGFQMGAPKLQMTLAKGALGGPPVYFSLERCQGIVRAYRAKNDAIARGWTICSQIIEDMEAGREGSWGPLNWEKETLWLPNGMALKYPNLKRSRSEETGWDEWTYQAQDIRKKIYGGLLCENIVQALARIVVGWQMLQIDVQVPLVMMTHDETVGCPRKTQAERAFKFMTQCMMTPPDWCKNIPLNCEGGYADNYSK